MKRILLGIVLILTGFLTQAQMRSDVAILDSVSHIATYYGGSKYIHVKDSVLGGAFYLYQGGLPVDNINIITGANSSKWKRMYGSYDRRYLSSVGGINNFTVTDSSLLIYLQNNLKLGTKFNQFVLTNVPYINIPTIYQAKGGSHNGTFNPSQLLLVRKFDEALNDTLMQMPYGGATTAYTEYRTTNGSTRFRYDNKHIILPNYGFYSDGRFYPGADSVEVRTNGNGQSGSGAVQAMSIGEVWGYNFRVNSTQYAPYPIANNISTYDFMRLDSRGWKRQITGNGVAGYVADWKNYQYADITVGTNNDASYINRVVDFYSLGGKDDTVGTDKTKIMQVSKVDSAIGFYSRQKYHPFNEVWNGYGFVQDGTEDYNHFQGRVKIGVSRPDRNNGGIAQNLLVQGSMRSDTAFHLYQKMDSAGRIVFTAKNAGTLGGTFLVQVNQTLDSNANQTDVAGGIRSYRNWLFAKNILIPEPTIDARNYYRVADGRTSTLQNCTGCSLAEYFGYKQVILGAGSTVNASGLEPRVFWARNEINGTNVVTKGKALGLNMTGFASHFVVGANVDSVGTLYGFKEDGFRGNTVNYITAKYGFFDSTIWQSNVGTQYSFYQVDNRIKNRFAGLTEFGSNIVYLSKDSIPYTATNGSRQMLTVDTVTGIQYRMDIPAGGGGGGLSGLTTNRVLFAGSSTTAVDDAGLIYNSTINELTTDSVKGKAIYGDSGVFVPQGRYDSDNSFWRPGIRFIGENKTGIARLAGITTFIDNGAKNIGIWREGADTDVIYGYGSNRLTVEATGSMNLVSLVGRMEFEGIGNGGYIDWTGYQAGSALGRTIRITTDATSYGNSVVPIHFVPRNHFHAFRITDSVNAVKTHFNYQGWLGIGNDTATTPLHIRSEAASDVDGAVITLDGVNLSNQGIRARYWSGGSPVTIWEEIANFNTGEVKNFIKAGGGYFHTWYSNGVKSMTLNNSGNLSIGTTANTYRLDVNGTGNFSGKLQLATTSTTIAPLNVGGFGTIPTSPTVGDVVFDASDSSIKVRSGSNWIPYYYSKDVVAGTNITIARGTAWNVPDTINASGGGVTDGDKGDITVTGTGATWTIDNQAVTYAKIQNVTDARLLGRSAGSAGSAQEITVSSDMSLSSGVLGVGSNVPLKNGTNTFTGANTFNTNDVTFSNINPTITGGAANLKYTDQNDARNLLVYLNTRKFTFLAQQTSFSSHIPLYFDLSAPVDAMNLHSTGTLRLNSVSTTANVADRKLYVNGSVGLNKDSLPTITTIGTENFTLVDNSTGQVKKVTAANVATSLGLNSSGTWTPTYTYTTNTSATSSGHFRYQQIGDQIYIHGDIVFNPTSTGVAQVDITLPFANGITNSYDVSGTGVAFDKAAEPVEIFYNNSGGTIAFKTTVAATGTRTYKFTAIMHYQAP